jgi:hypothetical protein
MNSERKPIEPVVLKLGLLERTAEADRMMGPGIDEEWDQELRTAGTAEQTSNQTCKRSGGKEEKPDQYQ